MVIYKVNKMKHTCQSDQQVVERVSLFTFNSPLSWIGRQLTRVFRKYNTTTQASSINTVNVLI